MDRRKQIDDFFSGKLSEAQARELLEWMNSPEGEEFMSAELLQGWTETDGDKTYKEWDQGAMWEKINRNKSGLPKHYVLQEKEPRKSLLASWVRYAAAVVVIGLVAVLLFQKGAPIDESPESNLAAEKWVERYNPRGQKTKIHLPDGSTVYLNADTKIAFREGFQQNREIKLQGEAYFEVAKDEAHPFSVESNGIVTTALGTSFNVSTHGGGHVKVTLVSGKVKLSQVDNDAFLVLDPGEESVFDGPDATLSKRKVDAPQSILWVDGVLQFDKATLREMVTVLERWYGVDIQVKGSPEDFKATGTFENNEPLRNVLDVLSSSIGFEYKLVDKQVSIKF